MSAFLTPFRAELLDERRAGRLVWRFLEPLVFDSAVAGRWITVPKGFVHDGESISLMLRGLTGPDCLRSGAVHDYLYTAHTIDGQPIERDLADSIYEEACIAEGLDPIFARQRYNAVRAFGGSHWA